MNTQLISAAVSSIDFLRKNAAAGADQIGVIYKIRFSPKTAALEILCKHLRLLDDDVPF